MISLVFPYPPPKRRHRILWGDIECCWQNPAPPCGAAQGPTRYLREYTLQDREATRLLERMMMFIGTVLCWRERLELKKETENEGV